MRRSLEYAHGQKTYSLSPPRCGFDDRGSVLSVFVCSLVGASFVLVEEERSNKQAAVVFWSGPGTVPFVFERPSKDEKSGQMV